MNQYNRRNKSRSPVVNFCIMLKDILFVYVCVYLHVLFDVLCIIYLF